MTTPGFQKATPKENEWMLRPMRPEKVAEQALDSLGAGPVKIPGLFNQIGAFLSLRLLPRRAAVGLNARTTRKVYGDDGRGRNRPG